MATCPYSHEEAAMFDFIFWEVRDVMTAKPLTIGRDTTIGHAQGLFEKHQFNGLPVVDESGRLLGMVTKLDVLKAFVFKSQSKVPDYETIMNHPVWEIMTRKPDTVEPVTPLTRALRLMIETGHKAVPVVEGEMLAGIVAREDVLRALHQAARGLRPERPPEPLFGSNSG